LIQIFLFLEDNTMNSRIVVGPVSMLLITLLLLGGAFSAGAEVACEQENSAIPAATPTAHFTDHGNGTVTHIPTGLMWMRCSLGQTWNDGVCTGPEETFTWQDALNAADSLNDAGGFAGHVDWRLPNRHELLSIIEWRCWLPAVNLAVFPGTSPSPFWTSTPGAMYDGSYGAKPNHAFAAWFVDFVTGYSDFADKSYYEYKVRLVRGNGGNGNGVGPS
jgi:hypothetical protein